MNARLPTFGVERLPTCRVITCLLLVVVGSQLPRSSQAIVANEPQDLRQSVLEAALVVRGRVERISRQDYTTETGNRYCGTNYSVQVLETYKGLASPQVEFATYTSPSPFPYREVREGEELLLLLRSTSEPLDPILRDKPDVIAGKPSAAKMECLTRLSRNRLSGRRGHGAFVLERFRASASEGDYVWLTYVRSFTKISHHSGIDDRPYDRDCQGNDCETDTRRRVLWTSVEPCIREWTKSAE